MKISEYTVKFYLEGGHEITWKHLGEPQVKKIEERLISPKALDITLGSSTCGNLTKSVVVKDRIVAYDIMLEGEEQ
jgi:hypothetical protein